MDKLTLKEYLSYLLGRPIIDKAESNPEEWKELLSWPPNAFGVSSRILEESGYYTQLVSPINTTHLNKVEQIISNQSFNNNCDCWIKNIDRLLFSDVKKSLSTMKHDEIKNKLPNLLLNKDCLPTWLDKHIENFFSRKNLNRTFREIFDDGLFIDISIILSSADHACAGLGVNSPSEPTDSWFKNFLLLGDMLLDSTERKSLSTFCSSRLSVIPKMLVPQTGISINSLSHNLACISGETTVYWNRINYPSKNKDEIDILIIPFPFDLNKDNFTIANDIPHLINKATYFRYTPKLNIDELSNIVRKCLSKALESQRKIDFIVFPEATFSTKQYHQFLLRLKCICIENDIKPSVVAGVITTTDERNVFPDKNTSVLTPWALLKNVQKLDVAQSVVDLGFEQVKHHRWQLDETQIATYGLTKQLPFKEIMWEAVAIEKRRISFNQVGSWFSLCTLVCEDLARQEPVAKAIRSVGPNLVIALLLDGPQLGSRWPGRYATGLTEEPGSSVLTVTSLGMSLTSIPKHSHYNPDLNVQRTIALWKDKIVGTIQISIDEGKTGVILNLGSQLQEEVSADGRSCGGEAVVLVYKNHYSV